MKQRTSHNNSENHNFKRSGKTVSKKRTYTTDNFYSTKNLFVSMIYEPAAKIIDIIDRVHLSFIIYATTKISKIIHLSYSD